MSDFPAAHSADTTWFAVDADGHIGVFDSGEGGAVPKPNIEFQRELWHKGWPEPCLYDLDELFWEWSQEYENRVIYLEIPSHKILDKLGLSKFDLSTTPTHKTSPDLLTPLISILRIEEGESSNINSDDSWIDSEDPWLFILAGNEAQTYEILKSHCLRATDYADYIVRFSGEPALLFITYCPYAILHRLFEQSLVTCAIPLEGSRYNLATWLGLFDYFHDCPDPIPYERYNQPIQPLKLDDLPKKIQSILTRIRFDKIKFSESHEIQPIEHMQCDTWYRNGWWMDTQGNEREGHPYDSPPNDLPTNTLSDPDEIEF